MQLNIKPPLFKYTCKEWEKLQYSPGHLLTDYFLLKQAVPWETEFQSVSLALLSVTEFYSHNWTQAKIPGFLRCFFISQLFPQQLCFSMVWLTLALQINKDFKVSGIVYQAFWHSSGVIFKKKIKIKKELWDQWQIFFFTPRGMINIIFSQSKSSVRFIESSNVYILINVLNTNDKILWNIWINGFCRQNH